MEEKEVFKSEWGRLAAFGAVCGAAVTALVYTVLYFGQHFIGALLILSLHRAMISVCAGVLAAVLSVLIRRTEVTVGSDEVTVKRLGIKTDSALEKVIPKSRLDTKLIGIFKADLYRCGLRMDGRLVRLYGFGEKSFERLADEIRLHCAENTPIEEKIAEERKSLYEPTILLSSDGLDGCYDISREKIVNEEKKLIGKAALISLALAAVLFFIGMDGAGFKEMVSLIIASAMAVSSPFLFLRCCRRAKLFPERIEISGEHLYIGGEHFSLTAISRAELTSPRKESDSIYPVQYFLKIRDGGNVRKYWLGSSLLCRGAYAEFCREMDKAFALYPKKLVIK